MKIIYLINHSAFFVSHRLDLYLQTKKKLNADCQLIVGEGASKVMEENAMKILKKKKISYFKTYLTSSKKNFFKDVLGIYQVYKFCKKFKPDIIHSATPKFNFVGAILSIFLNIKLYVCSISGMGYLYTSKNLSFFDVILKKINYLFFFFLNLNKKKIIITQNVSDYNFFVKKFSKKFCELIPSSGINIKNYNFSIKKKNKVILPARLLKDKGVEEFIIAASILKKKFPKWSFELIGASDYDNPSNINLLKFKKLIANKDVVLKQYQNLPKKIYNEASIVCLPSHREGFSKVILEAGILKIPIVASDIPGCKQGIINNKTGMLFKCKNINDLVKKLEYLIINKKKRHCIGENAHRFIKKNFLTEIINKKIINIYKSIYG